jgi:hypothetical protein
MQSRHQGRWLYSLVIEQVLVKGYERTFKPPLMDISVTTLILAVLLLLITDTCHARTDTRPQILVLGTYHLANRNRDLANVQADDVLKPKRQQDIQELIGVLKRFAPTKIAIEADYGSKEISQKYSAYLSGRYTLTPDETNQIGFRLAKELGHARIYPVNIEGEFPWQHVVNWSKANGMAERPESIVAQWTKQANRVTAFLRSHTILQTLEYMNSASEVAGNVGSYYAVNQLGDPDDFAGPDLLALWFQRNIRIYSNIRKLIDSPNDRILVIYGWGHLGWLRQDVANDPTVQLRTLDEFVIISPKESKR